MADKIKGVIFDFNGTMFFDSEFHEQAWRIYLEQVTGRRIEDREFQEYVHGRNAGDSLSYFLNRTLTREEIAVFEEEKEVIYRRLCLDCPEKLHLANGLPAFLDMLAKGKIPMTIATAAGWNNVQFFFEQFGLERWFDKNKVVFNDGKLPGKPEPDVYLQAAKNIQVQIQDCMVFEDARFGIEAARRAGVGMIIGITSMLDESALLSSGAVAAVQDYCDRGLYSKLCLREGWDITG